ncbi:hypothetical protein ACXZ66_12395 [Corynebacterium sp. S7]
MAYLALFLAVLALVGAGVLWYFGSRNAQNPPDREDPVEDVAEEPRLTTTLPPAEEESTVAEPMAEPEAEPVVVEQPEPEPEPEPEPAPQPAPRPVRKSGLHFPGATRRDRRSWAEQHGYEYQRTDNYLLDEWTRGAASSGVAAKDIVHGVSYGHETLLMDLGGTNVMAMRTGVVSDVVVDMRREGFDAESSDDLLEVSTIGGFRVYATEVGPAQRILDDRVLIALENMPEVVSAVWFETDWVLAQTEQGSTPDDWDAMLAPLGLLADAARVLPPQTWQFLEFDRPTREMGQPVLLPVAESHTEEPDTGVHIVRPEEPLELPTRTTGTVHGIMEHHAIGGDEVEAIADGKYEGPVNDGTRITRELKPPSIFGD